jgi:hypothetical protein
MEKIDGGCCGGPTKPLSTTNGPEALMPNGFTGNKFVGLRYMPDPQCGEAPGNDYGMTRAEYINWSTGRGHRVDPVEPLRDRLEDAGLYEFALTEPIE